MNGVSEIIKKNIGKMLAISFGEYAEDGSEFVDYGVIKSINGK